MTLKQKTLRLFGLLSLLAISASASAQVDFTPIFTQIKLEARTDFDYYHNTNNFDNTVENPLVKNSAIFSANASLPLPVMSASLTTQTSST